MPIYISQRQKVEKEFVMLRNGGSMIVDATESSIAQNVTAKGKENVAARQKTAQLTEENKEPATTETGVVVEISDNLKEMYQQQAESAKEAADAMGEEMRNMAKILEIARRISRGDHVPASDEKKLMEYDKDLYQMAKSSAALNAGRRHKKYKSLFEEEEAEQEEKVRELRRENSGESGSAGTDGQAEPASGTVTGTEGAEPGNNNC